MLSQELKEDMEELFKYTRRSPNRFEYLLSLKKNWKTRDKVVWPISSEE